MPIVPDLDEQMEQEKVKRPSESGEDSDKYQSLEKRLRAVEESDKFGNLDAKALGLVSSLIIPRKFKVPEFEKYNGTTDPTAHLRMYCRKMSGYEENEKLLIHCFQDSLTGAALRWYIGLDPIRIQTWADLARAFIDQYKHVSDWVPDRLSLMNMEKKAFESFRQYAQRWREEAAQVHPPLTEKEMTIMFVNTLRAPYYEKLVGNATKNFADMVISGEMIDSAIKSGKISGGESSGLAKKPITKGKDKEVNAVNESHPRFNRNPHPTQTLYFPNVSQPGFNFYPPMPQPVHSTGVVPTMNFTPNPASSMTQNVQPRHAVNARNMNNQQAPREREHFDPLPYSYKEMYSRLLAAKLVAPVFIEPKSPPYPRWYDESAYCEYHAGAQGHSIENCTSFKRKVQGLLNRGVIKVEQGPGPNVGANPLPNHAEPMINAIMKGKSCWVKRSVKEVKTPMSKVWQAFVRVGLVSQKEEVVGSSCCYCNQAHDLQQCPSFLKKVQWMMDRSEIEFYEEYDEQIRESVNALEERRTNEDGVLMCLSLMGIEKRLDESFRCYASRWIEKAAQIQPLLTEKEMIVRFIGTLRPPFYDEVARRFSKSFADIVVLCGMMDEALKKESGRGKKEGEVERKPQSRIDVGASSSRTHADPELERFVTEQDCEIVRDVEELRVPMITIWQILVQAELISGVMMAGEETDNFCNFHTVRGHTLQACKEFHALVQRLMKEGSIEFYDKKKTTTVQPVDTLPSINATEGGDDNLPYGVGRPLILFDNRPRAQAAPTQTVPKLIIQSPSPFPYKDNKAVPWNYESKT